MDRTSFINHLVYSSGQKDTKQNRTGASAIVEILKSVSILIDEDGKLSVNDGSMQEEKEIIDNSKQENKENKNEKSVTTTQAITNSMGNIQINVNVSCSVNELDELGDKLEKLLDKLGKNS